MMSEEVSLRDVRVSVSPALFRQASQKQKVMFVALVCRTRPCVFQATLYQIQTGMEEKWHSLVNDTC